MQTKSGINTGFRKAVFIAKLPFSFLILTLIAGIFFMDQIRTGMMVLFYFLQFYGLFTVFRTIWCLLRFSTWDQEQLDRTNAHLRSNRPYLNHMVVIPSYKEDINEIKGTMDKLAELRQASKNITVVLAMEQRDPTAPGIVAEITQIYGNTFREVLHTYHVAQQGELPGKGSNVAWMFNRLVMDDRRAALKKWDLIQILDVDTHHSQDYFDRIEAVWYATPAGERRKLYFSCPIAFNRNYNEVAWPVRMNDTLWSLAGLSSFYTGTSFAIATSTYAMSLELAIAMDGWDATPFGLGEDFHSAVRGHCETNGDIVTVAILAPASQLNVTRERIKMEGWWGDLCARYQQGCRHLWGVLTFSYVVESFINKPELLKQWVSWVILIRCIEPFMIIYVFVVSWMYLLETWTVWELLATTWANSIWFVFVYLFVAFTIFPKWNIRVSCYERTRTCGLLLLFVPCLIVCYTVMPALNAIFRHTLNVAYSGWVTSGNNKKPEGETPQQVDQLQTEQLLSLEADASLKENMHN